jgi:Protein of unknown function (DUF1616)
MTRTFADPRFVAALAVVSGLAALAPAPLLLRVPLTLPLALVLPGLALSLAFLPDSGDWLGRIPVSVATSVALSATSGLLLKVTPIGLNVKTWVPLLVGVTLVGAAVAARNAPSPSGSASRLRLGIPRRPALALLAAGALVVVAVSLARTPLSAGTVAGYSALWILPDKGAGDSIKVGVINAERGQTSYRLVMYAGGRVVFERLLTLSTGERWTGVVDVTSIPVAQRSFDTRLIKSSEPSEVYREVTLVLPGATVPPTTGVWLIPGRAGSNTMRVLVTSAEPKRERFRLELRAGTRVYRVLRPLLSTGERWSRFIDFAAVPPSERSFEARLYRPAAPGNGTPYRSATLVVTTG